MMEIIFPKTTNSYRKQGNEENRYPDSDYNKTKRNYTKEPK
jgi:hypothetical protein